jgi:hypothetical protein
LSGYAGSSVNIVLAGDMNVTQTFAIPANTQVTIYGAGYAITGPTSDPKAPTSVSAFNVSSGATVIMYDTKIQNYFADGSGGAFWVSGGATLTLNRVWFHNVWVASEGAIVYSTGDVDVTLTDITITNAGQFANGEGSDYEGLMFTGNKAVTSTCGAKCQTVTGSKVGASMPSIQRTECTVMRGCMVKTTAGTGYIPCRDA